MAVDSEKDQDHQQDIQGRIQKVLAEHPQKPLPLEIARNYYAIVPVIHEKGRLYLCLMSRGDRVNATSSRVTQTFLALALLSLVAASAGIFLIFQSWVTKPLQNLRYLSDAVAEGDLTHVPGHRGNTGGIR